VKRLAKLGLLVVAHALLAGAVVEACDDGRAHVFGAYRFEPDRGCLETSAAVDVISGPDPGSCQAVRCWISPSGEVYVTSTACDAPLDYREHTKDPAPSLCSQALSAFQCHTMCPADGSPVPPPDASCEGDAASEAGK
jgi:hypothetical protein